LSVLWTISLLAGGIIFWLYFFEIQYFPDLAFDESVLFLIIAAITGIIWLLFTAFLIMSPYFFRWWLFWDLNWPSTQNDEEKPDNEIYWYFGTIVLVFCDVFLYFYLEPRLENPWSSIIVTIIGLVIFSVHLQVYFNLISRIINWIFKKDSNPEFKS